MSAVFVMVGSVIGAGFASGKEIYIFFYGGNSFVSALLFFVLFFAAFFLISVFAVRFGIYSSEKLFGRLYGRGRFAAELALNFCYFLVLSTMIAAANLCLSDLAGVDEKTGIFAILTATLAGAALSAGIKGVKIINAVAVPLIAVFMAAMCLGGQGAGGETKILSAAAYVCFNTVMMTGILVNIAKNLTLKENAAASLASALILAALIWLVLARLNEPIYEYSPMPLISLAKSRGHWLYVAGTLVLYLSILTTVLSVAYPLVQSLTPFFKNEKLCVWGVTALAAVFSFAGFDAIIGWSYPVISALGAVLLLSVGLKLLCGMPKKFFAKKICAKQNGG